MRDKDVRAALWRQLTAYYAGDDNTRLVQEMGIWSGSVRIDVAVINGELSGFELKSDRDTLTRLPFQVELYSKVFDRLALVVGSRHATKARELIPEWWGITAAAQGHSGISLDVIREGTQNPSVNPYLVAQLLWKDEALAVLDELDLAKGWRSKRVKAIHQRLATELPLDDLRFHVRVALKRRHEWLRQMVSCHLDVPVDPDLDPML